MNMKEVLGGRKDGILGAADADCDEVPGMGFSKLKLTLTPMLFQIAEPQA